MARRLAGVVAVGAAEDQRGLVVGLFRPHRGEDVGIGHAAAQAGAEQWTAVGDEDRRAVGGVVGAGPLQCARRRRPRGHVDVEGSEVLGRDLPGTPDLEQLVGAEVGVGRPPERERSHRDGGEVEVGVPGRPLQGRAGEVQVQRAVRARLRLQLEGVPTGRPLGPRGTVRARSGAVRGHLVDEERRTAPVQPHPRIRRRRPGLVEWPEQPPDDPSPCTAAAEAMATGASAAARTARAPAARRALGPGRRLAAREGFMKPLTAAPAPRT
jgi:hypothetical protein